jgi:hypothetical protein
MPLTWAFLDYLLYPCVMTQGSKRTRKASLSGEHKEALTRGRTEAKVVREYLAALQSHQPKAGRKRTAESVRRRLAAIEKEIAEMQADMTDPLRLLELMQERIDLTDELKRFEEENVMPVLEQRFVEVAASFSARKGISYGVWRELGVPAAVLRRAGVRSGAA